MKIKRNVIETKEVEIEFELPYFLKVETSGTYVAILDERKTIVIRDNEISAPNYAGDNFLCDSSSVRITAEEFTRRFDRVSEHLQSFKSQFFNQAI